MQSSSFQARSLQSGASTFVLHVFPLKGTWTWCITLTWGSFKRITLSESVYGDWTSFCCCLNLLTLLLVWCYVAIKTDSFFACSDTNCKLWCTVPPLYGWNGFKIFTSKFRFLLFFQQTFPIFIKYLSSLWLKVKLWAPNLSVCPHEGKECWRKWKCTRPMKKGQKGWCHHHFLNVS